MSRHATIIDTHMGDHWTVLNTLVARYAGTDGWDPRRLWRLPAQWRPETLPHAGPAVYVVLGDQRCLYVGQTVDLHARFRGHLADPYRRERWQYVAAIVLKPTTPAAITNRLEREASVRLQPVDGRTWPRYT